MKPFGIGLIPMTSTDDVEVNLQKIFQKLKFFESQKADLVCLPENSLYYNFHKNLPRENALSLSNPAFQKLAQWSSKQNTYLHLGGIPIRQTAPADVGFGNAALGADQVFNTSVLITPAGDVKTVYKKIHLFDVDVGGTVYRESQSVDAGPSPEIIEINGWKIGLTICYDIRFAELFVHYHKQEVDLILVPAAFTVPTGRAHWSTLLRARAIETQAFIAAPGQVGENTATQNSSAAAKQTWGESLVIDPWGSVLARSPSYDDLQTAGKKNADNETPLWAELDPAFLKKTREQIPLLSHRRLRF